MGGLGAQLYESSALTFSGNTIEKQNLAAAIWSNPIATITGNTITNCTDGFLIDGQTSGSVTINNNSITGIAVGHYAVIVGGIKDAPSGTIWGTWGGPSTVTVDATNNWWGDASGPNDLISGDGSIPETNLVGIGSPAVGAVNYSNWTVPVQPAAPAVTNNDTLNTVAGMAAGMEYKLDAAGYVAYDVATFPTDFSGNHTLLVRIAAEGINPFGPDMTLTFTANPTPAPAPVSSGGYSSGGGGPGDLPA